MLSFVSVVFDVEESDLQHRPKTKHNHWLHSWYKGDIWIRGIGNKKFHYDNLIDPDGTYTPESVVLLYKAYQIDLEFYELTMKERLVVRVSQIEQPGELVTTKSYPPIPRIPRV